MSRKTKRIILLMVLVCLGLSLTMPGCTYVTSRVIEGAIEALAKAEEPTAEQAVKDQQEEHVRDLEETAGTDLAEPQLPDQQASYQTDASAEPMPSTDPGARPDVVVPEDGWVDFAAFVKLIHTGRWHFVREGEVSVKLEYFYQGREQIQGIETDKVMGNSREDNPDCWMDWIMWVDDQGQIVKLIVNDEVVDELLYGFYKLTIASPLLSFALEDVDPEFNQEFKQVLAGQQVPDWELRHFEQKKEQIGGKTADVYTVILEHWAFIGQGDTRFEYGDFGWFKLLLNRYDPPPHADWETLELTFRQ